MKAKEKILIVLVSVVIALISYVLFLGGYYSIDTERITSQGYINYALSDAYIRDGRLFPALILSLIGIINPSYKIVYIVSLLIAIFILSISVLQIYKIINYYKKIEKKGIKIVAFLISYLYIFNFVQIDIMQFIESSFIAASILLYIFSIKKTIIENNKKSGFIFALIGIFFYQGTITMYIATSFLVCLLETKNINKEFFKKIIPSAIITIFISVINMIIVNLIPHITGMQLTNRLNNANYLNNFAYNIKNRLLTVLVNTCGYFIDYLWIILNLVIILILFIYGIKKKKPNIAINLLIIWFVYILSTFVMFFVQRNIQNSVRVLLPIGESISAILIYLICATQIFEEKIYYKNVLTVILIFYFCINMYNTINITKQCKVANEIDISFALKMKEEIRDLEKDGHNIDYYCISYTCNGDRIKEYNYSNITYNNSFYLLGIYTSRMLDYYMGGGFYLKSKLAEQKVIEKYFDNPSDQEVQMKLIDNTLYVLIDF